MNPENVLTSTQSTGASFPGFAATAAVVLAAGAAAFFLFRRRKALKPFRLLQEKQKTLDTLDTPPLLEWAMEKPSSPTEERVVAYASRRWITRLGYRCPPELDADHNVIAFVLDKVDGTASGECLFSYGRMSARVRKLFGSHDSFILRD